MFVNGKPDKIQVRAALCCAVLLLMHCCCHCGVRSCRFAALLFSEPSRLWHVAFHLHLLIAGQVCDAEVSAGALWRDRAVQTAGSACMHAVVPALEALRRLPPCLPVLGLLATLLACLFWP